MRRFHRDLRLDATRGVVADDQEQLVWIGERKGHVPPTEDDAKKLLQDYGLDCAKPRQFHGVRRCVSRGEVADDGERKGHVPAPEQDLEQLFQETDAAVIIDRLRRRQPRARDQ